MVAFTQTCLDRQHLFSDSLTSPPCLLTDIPRPNMRDYGYNIYGMRVLLLWVWVAATAL